MVRPPTEKGICLRCKGSRFLCGKQPCPILLKYSVLKSIKSPILSLNGRRNVDFYSSSPPSFFVGHVGYPVVRVGPMIPHSLDTPLDIKKLDAPHAWLKPGSDTSSHITLSDIVKFRSLLVRTTYTTKVKGLGGDKIIELSQEIAMASSPVSTEVTVDKLHMKLELDNHSPPSGPIGKIEKIRITENPKVHPKVDYVVSDADLKAGKAIYNYLYSNAKLHISEIHRILSAGLLGEKNKRKLVPTRWSITAVDDIISRNLLTKIRFFKEINEFLLYEGEYLGNKFHIIFIPRPWAYEMMECWDPQSIWRMFDKSSGYLIIEDHEPNNGRKTYAKNVTGAYYAARLAVCEHLFQLRRQATVIVIREVNERYLLPLGVWVIRQTVRDALTRKPRVFHSLHEIFAYLKDKLVVPLKYWLKKSIMFNFIQQQTTLFDFYPRNE
ncbi:MAG: Nre family DNA repair protein [Promethearchaeota archaeon]